MVLNAKQARAIFPKVVGTIYGAVQYRHGFVLNMGPKSFGVMVYGNFIACCPSVTKACQAIEKAAV